MLVKLLSKIDYSFLLHSTPSPILYPIYKNSDNKELSIPPYQLICYFSVVFCANNS